MPYHKFISGSLLIFTFVLLLIFVQIENNKNHVADRAQAKVEYEGQLEIVRFEDFEKREISKKEYYLIQKDRAVKLRVNENQETQLDEAGEGTLLKASGTLTSTQTSETNQQFELTPSSLSTQQIEQSTALLGNKKVAVILFNFIDDTTRPYTVEDMKRHVFTTSNAYFKEYSFNKLGLTGKYNASGDIYGWYTLNTSVRNCDFFDLTAKAKDAVRGQGFDVEGYDVYIFGFPYNRACGGVGGWSYQNSAFINGDAGILPFVITHEVSHTFGIHHANGFECTDTTGKRVTLSDTCLSFEYYDPFDVMGSSPASPIYHLNNYFKGTLGWVEESNTLTVTQNGTYTILPIEKLATNATSTQSQIVRIPRTIHTNSDGDPIDEYPTDYYYLEFRIPYGSDNFASTDPVVNGISVRIAPPYSSIYELSKTNILDMSPETATFFDAALLTGKTFTDDKKGITIKTTSVQSSTAATAQITFRNPIPPPPTNLTTSVVSSTMCQEPSYEFRWVAPLTSSNLSYRMRIDDVTASGPTDSWNSCSSPKAGDFCNNNVTGTRYTRQLVPGHTYSWWLHAYNANGISFGSQKHTFTVPHCPTQTPTVTLSQKPGDSNGDNKVDGIDYIAWLNNYNTTTTAGASKGDYNNDGKVDGIDYIVWLTNYTS